MKTKEILNKIKEIVGVELTEETVKLAELKLENGTVLEAEAFEKGEAVFIKSDDERIALPVGEYILEDSRLLVVEEEGLIADVREVSDEVPAKEEDMQEELAEDDEAAVYDWAGMEKRIKQLEDAIADLKADKENKVDASEETTEQLSTEETKAEITELATETKEEEVAEPIKHNPEIDEKVKKLLFGQKRAQTTTDRVYNKISNIKN